MDNASDYGSELLGSTLGWLTRAFFASPSVHSKPQAIAFQPVFVVIVVPLFVFFFLQMFVALFLTAT